MSHNVYQPEVSGDLTIIQGTTFSGYFTTYNNGNTLNLENFSSRGKIKYKYSDTGSLLNLDVLVDSGNLNQGKVDIIITASDTASLPIGRFPYDIEVYEVDNSYVKRVSSGHINVVPEVTN